MNVQTKMDPRIEEALRDVIDPEIGKSVVDVGLIYEAEPMNGGGLRIMMTTTTRGCPLAGFLVDAVRERILAAKLADPVEVELTYDPPWSPDMMRA